MLIIDDRQEYFDVPADELMERLALFQLEDSGTVALGVQYDPIVELLLQRFPFIDVEYVDCFDLLATLPAERKKTNHLEDLTTFKLPYESNSVDLIISNLSVTFCPLQGIASESFRVLRDGGVLMTSAFGPSSFTELRQACAKTEGLEFTAILSDMHNFADLLLATGFTNPVVDVEQIEFRYSGFSHLVKIFMESGFSELLLDNPDLLYDKNFLTKLMSRYPNVNKKTGECDLSIEVFFSMAWKRTSTAVPFHEC